ncbi:MAG: Sulfate adenylyltransferase subunit 1 (EC [uncultured Sulfurovum sp.]|uniref:Sulfate adenylyltransferase subunit 1 n=1 Tax=uncultured Sulfurovum sp. TaxID=269237 RepID=A0A6S6TBG5_9BACT|nr:MAG: Sulfate adenylyltransferase subunit 1 (EC [uncultured Sulfurovum sp.]
MDNSTNIEAYLKEHEHKDMLRFLTCGSVDDGKSTLIGRMLYDSKMIFDDQLAAAESESKKYGTTNEKIDMALLVDGLQSEREQGITIDVAYRFFTTENRKFIIADTPGHEQYTRNMVTGASTADVAIILIDARKGILTQTRRHSFIVSLLGIKHVVVAINKMDLVDFDQATFNEIKNAYSQLADELNIKNTYYIPMSALDGDNVVDRSEKTPWYKGETLLNLLNTMDISKESVSENFRFPIQYVNRPNLDFRGFCGTIAGGSVKVGDDITILPSGKTTKVKSIIDAGNITESNRMVTVEDASAPMAITLTTKDEVDISRGDMIVHTNNLPSVSNNLKVMLVWMDEKPMRSDKVYDIKRATSVVTGSFEKINYKVDVNTYEKTEVNQLKLNDIASCRMVLTRPIAADAYNENRLAGSFIVVDRISNNTVGAGMIVGLSRRNTGEINKTYSQAEKELNAYVRKHFPEWDCRIV